MKKKRNGECEMGCCDNSLIEIKNDSEEVWNVNRIRQPGDLVGFKVGDSFGPGEKLSGSVTSAAGWNGIAVGGVQLLGDSGYYLQIYFFYRPASDFGACPCTPLLLFDKTKVGGFSAEAETKIGNNDGEASIKWTIRGKP